MAKGTWRLADDPNDLIYTGGYVVSSHNRRRLNGRRLLTLPPWVVLHIPHNSTLIPASVRDQFTLSDAELDDEILKMTDHHTHDLFAQDVNISQVVASPVSRLLGSTGLLPSRQKGRVCDDRSSQGHLHG